MLTAKKNNYRRTLDRVMKFSSAIGENTTINGQFTGGENIMVRGTVKGDSSAPAARRSQQEEAAKQRGD